MEICSYCTIIITEDGAYEHSPGCLVTELAKAEKELKLTLDHTDNLLNEIYSRHGRRTDKADAEIDYLKGLVNALEAKIDGLENFTLRNGTSWDLTNIEFVEKVISAYLEQR